jgi:hypothetical protein
VKDISGVHTQDFSMGERGRPDIRTAYNMFDFQKLRYKIMYM